MPRSMEANAQIKDERRGKIMLAALKIFTRKGFSAAKMSEIAEEAGISYGLAYHYFKSKDDIYTELVQYAIDSIGNVILEIHEQEAEPEEQVRKITRRVLNSIEQKEASGYYYLLIINALTCEAIPVEADKVMKESLKKLEFLSAIIREGQEKGQFREGNPMELAVTCFSALIGLASLKVSGTVQKLPNSELLMRILCRPQ